MLSVVGTYQNGNLKLDEQFPSRKPIKVIVNFLEEVEINTDKPLDLDDFSFAKSRKNLESYKGSFADSVIEGRRSDSW